jgi:hypothetical protein
MPNIKKRFAIMPLGIKAITILNTLAVVVALILSFMVGSHAIIMARFEQLSFAFLSILVFVIACGLWLLRGWVRYLYLIHLAVNAYTMHLQGLFSYFSAVIVGFGIEIVCVLYLWLSPNARRAFLPGECGKK